MSDLVSLIEHVEASLREASLGRADASANIFVLDDVTPRYAKAGAALKACNAGLGIVLEFLLDSEAERRLN